MPVDEETGLEPEMRIWRMTSKNRLWQLKFVYAHQNQ